MSQEYLSIFVHVAVALAVPFVITVLAQKLGGSHPEPAKYHPYESGHPTTPLHGRFPVKFYLVAMLFVIFDVEAAAFFPWALVVRELGMYAVWAALPFLIVFILGDLYVWKKGGFEWK